MNAQKKYLFHNIAVSAYRVTCSYVLVTQNALAIFSLHMILHRIKSRKVFVARHVLFFFYFDQSFSFFLIVDWCFMVGYFDHMTSIRFQFTLTICHMNSNIMSWKSNTIKNTCHGIYLHNNACFILAIQNSIYMFVYRLCQGFVCINYRVPSLWKCQLVRLGRRIIENKQFRHVLLET